MEDKWYAELGVADLSTSTPDHAAWEAMNRLARLEA
jgi:hypothetical protein